MTPSKTLISVNIHEYHVSTTYICQERKSHNKANYVKVKTLSAMEGGATGDLSGDHDTARYVPSPCAHPPTEQLSVNALTRYRTGVGIQPPTFWLGRRWKQYKRKKIMAATATFKNKNNIIYIYIFSSICHKQMHFCQEPPLKKKATKPLPW